MKKLICIVSPQDFDSEMNSAMSVLGRQKTDALNDDMLTAFMDTETLETYVNADADV